MYSIESFINYVYEDDIDYATEGILGNMWEGTKKFLKKVRDFLFISIPNFFKRLFGKNPGLKKDPEIRAAVKDINETAKETSKDVKETEQKINKAEKTKDVSQETKEAIKNTTEKIKKNVKKVNEAMKKVKKKDNNKNKEIKNKSYRHSSNSNVGYKSRKRSK